MGPKMTLKQLHYAVAVAETRHFGRAAQACGVSQPTLSAQVQQLEKQLGLQLFDRGSRRIRPTREGERVLAKARSILEEVAALTEPSRDSGTPLTGTLRLGAIPTLGPYLLPRVLPRLRASHPDLRLYLREDRTDRLFDHLAGGDLDAALVALPTDQGALEEMPLFDEPFVLATPPDHRLAQSDAPPTEAALAGEPVLLLEDGHCLRAQALDICGRARADVETDRFAATSLETLKEMVAGRIGITLLPALAAEAAAGRSEGLALTAFAPPRPYRRIGLVWRRAGAWGNGPRLFGETLRAALPPCVIASHHAV